MCFSITTPGCGDSLDKAGQCTRCLTEPVMEHVQMARILCGGVGVAGDGWDGPANLRMNLGAGVSGDGELQGVVLGEAHGVHRDSERVQKTLVV